MPVHQPARTLNLPALSSVWQVASVLLALCGTSPLTDVCLYTNVLVSAKIRMPIIRAYATYWPETGAHASFGVTGKLA